MRTDLLIKTSFLFRVIFMLLGMMVLVACNKEEQQEQSRQDIAVECCGAILTWSEIDSLTAGYSPEDSMRVVDEYIRSWAIEHLMYADSKVVNKDRIEKMVDDYRRSLYAYEYEQMLITEAGGQVVEDSTVESFYQEHKDQILLSEMLIKGALLVVPNEAPNMEEVRKYLSNLNDENSLEWVEKYAYQYGVGYELFVDEWRSREEVLERIPIEMMELDKMLNKGKLIELNDSINTYFLEIDSYCAVGSVMPMDYARKQIEDNILRTRNEEFIRTARQKLYDESLKNGKLKRYAK